MASLSIHGKAKELQLIDRLGSDRMQPYLEATDQYARRALFLYRWNSEISASMWQLISLAEVVLRNRLDLYIGRWCQDAGGDRNWLLNIESMPQPLKAEFSGKAKTFKEYAKSAKYARDSGGGITIRSPHPRAGEPLTNSDVLAQITLGIWGEHFIPRAPNRMEDGTVKYLPDETTYQRRLELWTRVIQPAFPAGTSPGELSHRLNRLKLFRNRIAHHEPILDVDIAGHRDELLKLIQEVDPVVSEWYLGNDPIPKILDKDPRRKN